MWAPPIVRSSPTSSRRAPGTAPSVLDRPVRSLGSRPRPRPRTFSGARDPSQQPERLPQHFNDGGHAMFFVTFHGDINNVYAYDDDGNWLNSSDPDVLDASGQTLSELRGMYLDPSSGQLYVANGASKTSNVLCFKGSGTSYSYVSTFIESPAAGGPKSVIHPYS